MTNNHYNEPAFPDGNNSGLTKLEYAAIHLCASAIEKGGLIYPEHCVQQAKKLLTELNKETNAND